MKKISIILLAFVGLFVFSFTSVSAFGFSVIVPNNTYISGIVYDASSNETITDANVTAFCSHDGSVDVRMDNILVNGSYEIIFPQTTCASGDLVTVEVVSGSLTGVRSGVVGDTFEIYIDAATANVALVPEFGFVIGMLTMISAIGIFFIVRKD